MTFDRLHAPLNSTRRSPARWWRRGSSRDSMSRTTPIRCWCMFHARGGDEEQLVRAMPALDWRNYVGLGLRGPEPVIEARPTGGLRLGVPNSSNPGGRRVTRWPRFPRPRRCAVRFSAPSPSRSTDWRRLSSSRSCKLADCFTRPLGADLPGRVWRGGRGRLLAGPVLSRAVRRRGRDQRLAAGRPAAAGTTQGLPRPARPCRPRGLECQSTALTTHVKTWRRFAPAACESPFSPTPAAHRLSIPCSPTSTPG